MVHRVVAYLRHLVLLLPPSSSLKISSVFSSRSCVISASFLTSSFSSPFYGFMPPALGFTHLIGFVGVLAPGKTNRLSNHPFSNVMALPRAAQFFSLQLFHNGDGIPHRAPHLHVHRRLLCTSMLITCKAVPMRQSVQRYYLNAGHEFTPCSVGVLIN